MCLMIETVCPSAATIAGLGRCDNPNANVACTNTCAYASDGECDDGGPGSEFATCVRGTDCFDCGVRQPLLDNGYCRGGTGLCGTSATLNNCGTDDVYRMSYRMRPSPPSLPPPPPRKPPPQSPSPAPPPSGCRNSAAINYRPFAVVDDGSCLIGGCTDSRFPQYNPAASYDNGYANGGCAPPVPGCTNSAAVNYQASTTYCPTGNCCVMATRVYGCMNSDALNYNPSATYSNATAHPCIPRVRGCTNSAAANYNALYNTLLPGSCIFFGCTNSLASNYNAQATNYDGSCPAHPGCTDPAALNYNAVYNTQLTGSCSYGGCRTQGDPNYNARNTFAIPGSCAGSGRRLEEDAPGRRLQSSGCMDPA